eukprot:NODE_780_length_3936_cov_0.468335.p5 type:complete len:109 gc:universal NODE_780_length_3936_cov_0.468335:963-637(-)
MSEYLANKKIKCLYVSKGATKYCQVADVAIIRSLKCYIRKSIRNFYTKQVNNLKENSELSKVLKKSPIGNLRKWIVEHWACTHPNPDRISPCLGSKHDGLIQAVRVSN